MVGAKRVSSPATFSFLEDGIENRGRGQVLPNADHQSEALVMLDHYHSAFNIDSANISWEVPLSSSRVLRPSI